MKIRIILLLTALSFLLPHPGNSQELYDKTLMTIAGKNIPAGEFIRMYKKSSEPDKQPDADEYLQQYINFKLKVTDAMSLGTDTTSAFLNELNGYRKQLARNYLTDTEVKETLLRKAYERSLTEINGWHILVNCPENSSPADTLIAWQKASAIRERIIKGEQFEQVARGSSDDPSVRINGGNLGYFTVFQMISPFEDAAYALKTGGVSTPVRTPYGYHIIKVTDKRPVSGKVLVAHIMKVSPPGANEDDIKAAEKSINDLYDRLREGESFSELARQYSDDKESAKAGGQLNWFGAGEIISDFAEAAFALKDTGTYTKPVRSPYGWHIIKLLERKPHGSYEELRSFLESRINQSYLNSLSRKTFVNSLKKEYNFTINQAAYNWFVRNTDTLIIQGLSAYKRSGMPSANLYTFADRQLSTSEFASFIEKRGSGIVTGDPVYFIRESIETLVSDQLIKYEDSMLEEKYPDFRYLMKEFHDGILLFDISERKIWKRVQEDTTGLQRYYDDHRQNYLSKKGIVEATPLPLEEVRGEMMTGYQEFLENEWVEQLKIKYPVKIDAIVFEEIKKSLNNE